MSPAEAWRRLATAPVAVLATIGSNGQPHLVPFVFAPLDERALVSAVDEKPKGSRRLQRLENIGRDPRVTVLAHHYEDDWSRLWWVRAEGTAEVVDTPPVEGETLLRSRYPAYENANLGPWILIAVTSVAGWAAT